jgi:hypothetical protein
MAPGLRPTTHAEFAELTNRIQQLEKKQRWVTAALAVAVLVAVAWPIALSALSILRAGDEKLPTLPTANSTPGNATTTSPPAPAAPAAVTASDQKEDTSAAENEQHVP